jgi:two-component system OmpR family sensor kinase
MHFDDRLATVLRMRADGHGLQRIQFRQLLDLLGTSPAETRGAQLDMAYDRLAEIGEMIAAPERTAVLRDLALRLRSPRLVAALSAGEPQVAATTLQRAQLSREQWLDLIPALPPAACPALRQRSDLPAEVKELLVRLGINDRGLPAASMPAEVTAAQPAPRADIAPSANDDEAVMPPSTTERDDGIGAIVRRIEAYRRAKQVVEHQTGTDSPRLPLGEDHVLSVPDTVRAADFASDAQLRIAWCDAGIAPMLIGLRLNRTPTIDHLLRQRQPLSAQAVDLNGAPAISGRWQIDAAPWFDPLTGQFLGYRGRLRRPAPATRAANPPVTDSAADRIRQMLHELRTPVNAIQGFAEVIQQQLFGPVPHEYRALAAGIAGDAARMLSAFEELERLARFDSGAMDLDPGETDLASLIAATVAQLGAHTTSRGSGFAVRLEDGELLVGLARLELERIVWRLLATLAGTSAPGEQLKLRLRAKDGLVRLDLALPAALAAKAGDALFETGAGAVPQVIAAGVFGVGFALRLARAEARAGGGELLRKGDRLRLTLPGLTGASPGHTESAGAT